jgi:hypothetical protein
MKQFYIRLTKWQGGYEIPFLIVMGISFVIHGRAMIAISLAGPE